VTAQSQQLVATVLPQELQGAAAELGLYLSDSLGALHAQDFRLSRLICKCSRCVGFAPPRTQRMFTAARAKF
jgi:hypothetical protein